MKSKLSNVYNIVNYIMSKEKFKMIYWIAILICIYGAFFISAGYEIGVVDGMLICFSFIWFNIAIIFLLLLNTFNICSVFNEEFYFLSLRLKSKKNVLKQIIIYTFIINMLLFVMILLISFSFMLIAKFGNLGIKSGKYDILNVIYLIFYLARYTFVIIFLTVLNSLLYYKFNNKIFIVDFIFCIGLFIFSLSSKESFWYNITPYNFLCNVGYDSFSSELLSTVLFMLFAFVIIYGIFKILTKKEKKYEIYFSK